MSAALRKTETRTLLILILGVCAWIAAASGTFAKASLVESTFLLVPLISIGCSAVASHLRLSNRPWRLEAPFLAACFGLLGPYWFLGTTAAGKAASLAVRSGRSKVAAELMDLLAMLPAFLAVEAMRGLGVGSVAPQALTFVLVWRGCHMVAAQVPVPRPVPIFLAGGMALALGGLVEQASPALILAGLVPTALVGWLARSERRADASVQETLQALALMLQRAHPYTHAHIERVARLAEKTALHLGLSTERAAMLKTAARLHDVGKIAVDEKILDKPEPLTAEEYAHVKLHAPFGAAILEEVEELRPLSDWIRFHHERPDGQGYPDGLRGGEIPIEARIIAIADAFDAMTGGFDGGEKRPYREPISPQAALVEMERHSGSQFDPRVLDAFKLSLGEEIEA